MRHYVRYLVLLGLLAVGLALFIATAPRVLIVGIVPQHSSTVLARQWNPILRHLSEETGYWLVFRPAPSIPAFEERLFNGRYDIAYMNPYHYVVAHEKVGYQAFARQKNERIQGIIVVQRDAPYNSLAELGNRALAFPSPHAFAASILTRSHLRQAGIPFEANYLSSHDKVYRSVAYGHYPAGGGIMRTLDQVSPSIRQQLRVLWKSREYTPHAIAAHPDLKPDFLYRLQKAMVEMSRSDKDRQLLEGIEFEGFVTAQNSDWDDIRELNVEPVTNNSVR
ncbi:MAG: phosphate/phosphite/phosphonate ABC transporter substrate-binding protein [Pseudomonadota bacterium]|nr:phosphate/phosphite/phosphonate ABC transporter substrate-binding protein [Pseudomonadota bacterium]